MPESEDWIGKCRELARTIRVHCLHMTHRGKSGHLGSMLSMAELLSVLYERILRVDPKNPHEIAIDWDRTLDPLRSIGVPGPGGAEPGETPADGTTVSPEEVESALAAAAGEETELEEATDVEQLDDLEASGVLTEDEVAAAKRRLLGS